MIPVQRPFLGREELEAVQQVFDSRWLGMGSITKQFEDRLRDYLGGRYVVSVNTGTSALQLALESLELTARDEVIVPSLTFVASVQVILSAGATPVFCDVEANTLNIDAADALARITDRTKVILPVHYAGVACDIDLLLEEAQARGLRVVEDAAHAFGSTSRGRRIGSFGDITCFSFDPIKNITCGEGGAIVTADQAVVDQWTRRRLLGIDNDTWSRYRNERNWFYEVVSRGHRYHLSNINAAIGLAQLKRIDEFRARKQAIAARYDQALRDQRGLALLERNPEETFPFFYVIRVLDGRRDAMIAHLKGNGIGSGVHYIPNHLQPAFAAFRTPLPVTEQVYDEILTLPLFFEMTDDEVERVIGAVCTFRQQ
jgi:dTDP-4-amino-4,6-dideoxygalactose transaminase